MDAFRFTGGYDPHHLVPHLHEVIEATARPISPGSIVREGRRLVLFVDRFDEWPGSMHSLVLTGSEQPSWRVDVVARRDGYLGQFRRCWQCRRWFQGRAELHLLGHEESSDNR